MGLPHSPSRADAVVDFVERKITEQGLRPGDRVGTREDLRDATGVAKATVNEAVKLLQDRSRVTVRPGPGGGLFVAAPDPVVNLGRTLLSVRGEANAVAESIVVREQLEPLVAADAATHRTRGDRRELARLMRDMSNSQDDLADFVKLNWDLHVRIARISPNQVLYALYVGLYEFVNERSLVAPQPRDAAYLAARVEIHQQLVSAIDAGDVEAAVAAAEQHRH